MPRGTSLGSSRLHYSSCPVQSFFPEIPGILVSLLKNLNYDSCWLQQQIVKQLGMWQKAWHSLCPRGPFVLAGRCVRSQPTIQEGRKRERITKYKVRQGTGRRHQRLRRALKDTEDIPPIFLIIVVVIKVIHSNCKKFGKSRKMWWKQKSPPATPHIYNQFYKIIIILYTVL